MTALHSVLSARTHSRACAHPTVGDRQPEPQQLSFKGFAQFSLTANPEDEPKVF